MLHHICNANCHYGKYALFLLEDSGTDEKELLKPIQEQNINVVDHDLREDERMTSEVEAAYQRVHQFIGMMEELKSAPQSLQNLYELLKIGDRNLQDSVNSLRHNVDNLKHLGSNVTETK